MLETPVMILAVAYRPFACRYSRMQPLADWVGGRHTPDWWYNCASIRKFGMCWYTSETSYMGCEDAGALVHNVEQDDRLDSAVVSFLVVAQERLLKVLVPPEAIAQQPLTLALLQASSATLSCSVTACHHLCQPAFVRKA